MSKRTDSGVSNFEKTLREIANAKLSVTVPILVIGLENSDNYEWSLKEVETNIEILKESKKKYIDIHEEIVRDYIDKNK